MRVSFHSPLIAQICCSKYLLRQNIERSAGSELGDSLAAPLAARQGLLGGLLGGSNGGGGLLSGLPLIGSLLGGVGGGLLAKKQPDEILAKRNAATLIEARQAPDLDNLLATFIVLLNGLTGTLGAGGAGAAGGVGGLPVVGEVTKVLPIA